MLTGIVSGIISALLMSGSYIFSRAYFRKHNNPLQLAIHSQFNMLFGGIILLAGSLFFIEFPWNREFYLYLAAESFFFLFAQVSWFMMLRHVEASRAASLIGLKVLAIAILTFLMGDIPTWLQWLAIVLCSLAAVGMNYSGGKIPLKSIFWLIASVFGYALCDICITKMMNLMPGESVIRNAFGVMGIIYTTVGILVLPGLKKYPPTKARLKEALPYSAFYLGSSLSLMVCFGSIGVVFGSIIQSSRGVISVILGVILVKLGLEKSEPDIPLRLWIRKLIMAILMLAAMTLYAISAL